MKGRLPSIACLLLLASGCNQSLTRPVQPVNAQTQDRDGSGASPQAQSQGAMVLSFYDADATGDETGRPPTLRLEAEQCRHEGGDAWSFEEARAIIYGKDRQEILIEMRKGRLDHATKKAYMEGGVTVRIPHRQATIELEDLEWSNEERVAKSDHAARILQGNSAMTASSIRFYPDKDEIVMTDLEAQLKQGEGT